MTETVPTDSSWGNTRGNARNWNARSQSGRAAKAAWIRRNRVWGNASTLRATTSATPMPGYVLYHVLGVARGVVAKTPVFFSGSIPHPSNQTVGEKRDYKAASSSCQHIRCTLYIIYHPTYFEMLNALARYLLYSCPTFTARSL